MSSAKRYLVVALSFALAMIVFSICAPRAVHAITATLVQIVNTSANPVPVVQQGPVNTSGSNINVANTPTVNVASMPPVTVGSVTVTNPSDAPVLTRDVENPTKFRLLLSGTVSVPAGFVGAYGYSVGPAIPTGTRYVIEYVSVMCPSNSAVHVSRAILSTAESTTSGYRFHNYPVRLHAGEADYSGTVDFVSSEAVHWYHDGGTAVQFGMGLTGVSPAAGVSCYVELSGHVASAT